MYCPGPLSLIPPLLLLLPLHQQQESRMSCCCMQLPPPWHAGPAPFSTSLERMCATCVKNAHGLRCVPTSAVYRTRTITSIARDPKPCISAQCIIYTMIVVEAKAAEPNLCVST
jgi:hypothetical protein